MAGIPGLYGVLGSFLLPGYDISRPEVGISVPKGEKQGPGAGVMEQTVRKVRTRDIALLVTKVELFRFYISLYNSAFCSGFLEHYRLFPWEKRVYSGRLLPAAYPMVLTFLRLKLINFRRCQEYGFYHFMRNTDPGAGVMAGMSSMCTGAQEYPTVKREYNRRGNIRQQ